MEILTTTVIITEVITAGTISVFKKNNYYQNEQYVYKTLFGEGRVDRLKLDQVYDDPRYDEEDILDFDDDEFYLSLGITPPESNIPKVIRTKSYDSEIYAARNKLDSILSSSNVDELRIAIKEQRSYTTLDKLSEITEIISQYTGLNRDEIRSRLVITPRLKSIMDDIRTILDNQLSLLHEESYCRMYRIEVYHNHIPYGSIFVFYNEKLEGHTPNSKYIMIQEIAKYPIPMYVQVLFPEFKSRMPTLNSLLAEPINTIAKEHNADYIYVHPFEDQAMQLQKYYGYKKLNYKWILPCNNISQTFDQPRYYKDVDK